MPSRRRRTRRKKKKQTLLPNFVIILRVYVQKSNIFEKTAV
jgi:hypothetical protein